MERYLVWSPARSMWWGPDGCGLTPHLDEAGRYPRDAAAFIARIARDAQLILAP